jgi:hypothetical protein
MKLSFLYPSMAIPAGFALLGLCACGKADHAQGAAVGQTNLVSHATGTTPPSAPLPTTGTFEGEIVVDVKPETTSSKLPPSVTFEVKGDKVRYEPKSASVRASFDSASSRAYVISDSKKTFSDIDTKPQSYNPAPEVKLERSNKKETVAGLGCEDWTVDDGTERADVCAAKGIAFFDPAVDARSGHAEPGWARALTKEKAFPLRVVVHDRSGKEAYRAEAFEAHWKRIDDSAFQIPNGYRKGDLTPDTRTASLP